MIKQYYASGRYLPLINKNNPDVVLTLLNESGKNNFTIYVYDKLEEFLKDISPRFNGKLEHVPLMISSEWIIKSEENILINGTKIEVYKNKENFLFLCQLEENNERL